ncbi:MAG: ABC transporter permease [Dehalococcoidia bacterium]
MLAYVVRRLIAFVPTLFAVALLVSLMIYLVPGNPAVMMLGVEATPQSITELEDALGLNDPLIERLGAWFGRAVRGDFGRSYLLGQDVTEAILTRLPVTLNLALGAMLVALVVGIGAGTLAAIRQNGSIDWAVMLFALVGLSIPNFWLGLNLIFLGAVTLRWFPTGGYVAWSEDPSRFVLHLALPALTLGLSHAALIARMTRASMIDVLRVDYVRTARAKGLSEWVVVGKHAFRNALIPIVTVVGISTGVMIGGAVVIETVFGLPGVGRLIINAVQRRDYPIVQGGILFVTVAYLVVNLIVDLMYVWIHPQIRYG